MISLKIRFTIVCDWCNKKRACAADYSLDSNNIRDMPSSNSVSMDSIYDFDTRAIAKAKKDGWHVGLFQLCPEHNTAANRKKASMPQPAKGSVARTMRAARI